MTSENQHKILLFSLFAAILGFIICVIVLYTDSFNSIDRAFEALFTSYWDSRASNLVYFLTQLGGTVITAIVTTVMVMVLFFKKKKDDIAVIFLAGVLGLGGVFFLKHLFGIDRPLVTYQVVEGFRFPSGHAATSMFLALSLLYVLREYIQTRFISLLGLLCVLGFTFIIGGTRIYLNVHKVIDVCAGYFIVLAGFSISLLLLQRFKK